jgi:hypothetical protein
MTPTPHLHFPYWQVESGCMTIMVCVLIFIACMLIWDLISKVTRNK